MRKEQGTHKNETGAKKVVKKGPGVEKWKETESKRGNCKRSKKHRPPLTEAHHCNLTNQLQITFILASVLF